MGYQCQKCAKFVTFDSEPIGEAGLKELEERAERSRCECGGEFARDQPIRCPRCKSVNVEYGMELIT